MRYSLVALFFFFAPIAQAYNPIVTEITEPFAEIVIPMDVEAQQQSYLGTLETYPHLYEFTIEEATTLAFKTRQRARNDAEPVNLILISVDPNTQRITEEIRLNDPIEDRAKKYIGSLGISVYESRLLEVPVEPGVYRLEVSTPLNESPYELDFGVESSANSYFGTFGTIATVQKHFGYSFLRYPLSTFILYQLGIILIIGGFVYTWRKRKEIAHVST